MEALKISNEIFLTEEFLNQIADLVTPLVVNRIKDQLEIWNKVIDLPPCPNKSEIKRILEIGDASLDTLIANGATPMTWGSNTVRIQRSDLLKAFENTKMKL